MGISTAGLVVVNDSDIFRNRKNISRAIGKKYKLVTFLGDGRFDTRAPSDVYIAVFENCSILYHSDLINPILFKESDDYKRIYVELGNPKLFILFCCYESGGSYGYAIIQDGIKVRARVQTIEKWAIEFGEPYDFEKKWNNSKKDYCEDGGEYFTQAESDEIRSSEYFTHGLLNDCLIHFLGFNPLYQGKPLSEIHYRYELLGARDLNTVMNKWNWGAFLCNWVWSIWYRQWYGLAVFLPYVGILIVFALGKYGNALAWKSKSWKSIEDFEKSQRKWAIAGLIFWSVFILSIFMVRGIIRA